MLLLTKFFNRLNLLPYLNMKVKTNLPNGINIVLPIYSGVGLDNITVSEPWLIDLIKGLYSIKEGTFVDIGVNLGQTLLKVKAANPQQPYIGFEPSSQCVAYVENLIRLNNFSDTRIIPICLSNKTSLVQLFMKDNVDSSASIVENFRPKDNYKLQKFVFATRFDDLISQIEEQGNLSIIKIDVEGAEADVLQGAKNSISQFRPFILAEILPTYDETSSLGKFRKLRQEQIEIMLSHLNYAFFRIDHTKGKLSKIQGIETHSNLKLCDYLFIPQELLNKIPNEWSIHSKL